MRASSQMELQRVQGSPTGGPAADSGHSVGGAPPLGARPRRRSGADR